MAGPVQARTGARRANDATVISAQSQFTLVAVMTTQVISILHVQQGAIRIMKPTFVAQLVFSALLLFRFAASALEMPQPKAGL